MATSFRTDLARSLKLSMGIFPEGTAYYNNIRAALSRVDTLLNENGTGFANDKTKRGVLMILDETLSYLGERENTEFVSVDIMMTKARLQILSVSS